MSADFTIVEPPEGQRQLPTGYMAPEWLLWAGTSSEGKMKGTWGTMSWDEKVGGKEGKAG